MLMIFQVCFFVGVGLTVIAAISGSLFGIIGIDGLDFDFGGADIMVPTSPIVYIVCITVFGGVGIICLQSEKPLHIYLIFGVAVASGVVSAILFNKFVVRPLKRAQNTSAADESELIGLIARVTEKIFEDGFGEISYVIHGNTYTAPAKSVNGGQINMGMEIVIYAIENHIFYVSEYELTEYK